MALQYKLKDGHIETSEDGHPLVFDDQDEDQKEFALDAIHLYSKVPTLQGESKKYREANEQLKSKLSMFGEVEPEEIAEKLQTLEEFGEITPKEAKNFARGIICLEGNIQINRMFDASPDEIREETESLIKTVFNDNKGLIVSPTASPFLFGQGDACFPQYKAMIDAVLNWK